MREWLWEKWGSELPPVLISGNVLATISLGSEGPAGLTGGKEDSYFRQMEGHIQKQGSENRYSLFWEQQKVGNYC